MKVKSSIFLTPGDGGLLAQSIKCSYQSIWINLNTNQCLKCNSGKSLTTNLISACEGVNHFQQQFIYCSLLKYGSRIKKDVTITPEAVFLVVCDPSMNEL
jgi:hypothetical protein